MTLSRTAPRAAALYCALLTIACAGCALPAGAATPRSATPGCAVPAALPDFVPLIAKYGPAVVDIEVIEQPAAGGPSDSLNDFFHRFGVPGPGESPGGEPAVRGKGSGFIVSPNGYILTNEHVVQGASRITVHLLDGREFQATVVGMDEPTDIAVLKIPAAGLPVVKLGEAATVRPGQWVLAIGSPFGFTNSATAGIVSAVGRALPSENYVSFIQTDVPVNPGNSGGPLFNLAGEVVGINSEIYSRTGGFMGVSFAIPIAVAESVEQQIIRTGYVVRGKIGVTIQSVTADLADSFGLDGPRGALVSSVEARGPAAVAGIRPGDVVLAVDGHPIRQYGELASRISALRPGSEATLEVWRDRRDRMVRVRVEELAPPASTSTSRVAPQPQAKPAVRAPNELGLTVRPLEPQEKAQAQTAGDLVVEDVSGAAELAGVEPGDIILGVDGRRISTVKQLESAARSARGGSLALLIQRDNTRLFLPIATQ